MVLGRFLKLHYGPVELRDRYYTTPTDDDAYSRGGGEGSRSRASSPGAEPPTPSGESAALDYLKTCLNHRS